MYRKWSTLVLLTLVTPLVALAQNTGVLAGRVTDRATGEGLPGATVTIVGTTLGASTDVDGNYRVLGVPVGRYDIRAEYIGYAPGLVTGVEINSGYTREINFTIAEGEQSEEIVVEYERPIIQRDALGTPRVVSGEDIQNLPVRGVASVAALQAGVVNNEGSGTLNVRGGRGEEVVYYVDGVKVVGTLGVSQQAIAEQEMLIGGLPARYGDAMAGVISVTTKNGSNRFFGTVEGVTSQALDAYGYSSGQLALGGPVVGNRVGFFVSGEYQNYLDSNPRALGVPQLSDEMYDMLQAGPQAIRVLDANGNTVYRQIPANSTDATFTLRSLQDAGIFQAGDSVLSFDPVNLTSTLTADDFSSEARKPKNSLSGLNLGGKINVAPIDQIRLVFGGQYVTRESDAFNLNRSLFAQNTTGRDESQTGRGYFTWSHYLSNRTFYQIQADYQDVQTWSFDPRFGKDLNQVIRYADIDADENALTRAYRLATDTNQDDVIDADSIIYRQQFGDGSLPTTTSVFNLYALPGAQGVGYSKGRTNQLRLSANAQTQLGLHQIEFGGEYEQRTIRGFTNGALATVARLYDDGTCEAGSGLCVSNYADIPYDQLRFQTAYVGYNYNGTQEVDDEDIAGFNDRTNTNIAPYKPIYYAGYISDKIEYRDLVVQLGVRVDVYDANQRVLFDPFSFIPLERAGDVGLANDLIGSDFAVYYNNNNVAGYRDREGRFYDVNGQVVTPNAVITNSAIRPRTALRDPNNASAGRYGTGELAEAAFEDYKPEAIVQPRIGVTFPVTDQALFFAHYDVLAQRPTTNQFANLQNYATRLESAGNIGNPALKPQTTTEYEVGFRQRLGERMAVQISGFYRQIDNLIQLRALKNTFPNNYSTYQNVDFGTVKGLEFEFDLRRTNNVSLTANYTLSFAEGTGSDANTTGNIFWLREANPYVPNFLSPLDFDRRHSANIAVDYRLGADEGPSVGGFKPLSNFGVNLIARFRSGQPYSRLIEPYPFDSPVRLTGIKGEVNGQTLPATSLVDLKVDRRFQITRSAALTAYVEVENLLDTDNPTDVWQTTGLADDDGYLSTDAGLTERPLGSVSREYYQYRLRTPFNYGIPRQTRLGLRLNF